MVSRPYDVAIIGGGIIGLATALQLTRRYPKCRTVVLEKEGRLAVHQTGHNSGVVHSGIYYRPDSHKAQLCVAGAKALVQFCQERDIPYKQCGKVIVATEDSELGSLDEIYRRGTANGVEGLEMIGPERLKELEPHAAGIKAIHVPGTGVVDFTAVAEAYADGVRSNGGEVLVGARVSEIKMSAGAMYLDTQQGTIESRYMINCAGLHADEVARMAGVEPEVRIIPFRGEYFTLTLESRHLVRALIYPVPNPSFPFLGVHFTRGVHGDVEAGPNAVLALAKEGYTKSDISLGDTLGTLSYPGFWAMAAKYWKVGVAEHLRSFSKRIFLRDLQRLVPQVRDRDLGPGGSGVRAQAVDRQGRLLDDFIIQERERAIHVLNAPSPGATSSLSIGDYIAGLASKSFDIESPRA